MAWKRKYTPDPPKRAKRSFDVTWGLLVVLTIVALAFGLDRVARYVTGESGISAASSPRTITPSPAPSGITVIDGDTVRADGKTWRLVGFNTPESGREARCDKERDLAAAAAARLQHLIAYGAGEP